MARRSRAFSSFSKSSPARSGMVSRTKPARSPLKNRRYHEEPDAKTKEEMRLFLERTLESYRNRMIIEGLRVARGHGLSRKETDDLINTIFAQAAVHKGFPVDEHGKNILKKDKDGEWEIVGGKIREAEKTKRDVRPAKNMMETLRATRREINDLRKRYPGIDMNLPAFRDIENGERNNLDFFKLSPEKRKSLHERYFELTKRAKVTMNDLLIWDKKHPKH